jgi:tetratricopeptide (TPR) repeat protein
MQHPEYVPYRPKSRRWGLILLSLFAAAILLAVLLMQIPRVNRAVSWRADIALTYVRMLLNPVDQLPPPSVSVQPSVEVVTPTPAAPTAEPLPTATPLVSPTPTLVPTPIPAQMQLNPPAYDEKRDKQDWNNCGPATLALHLRYYGWQGNQFDISDVIKPTRDDRNVNVEELVYYVRTKSGWLNAEYRVGGSLERLKQLIAAGIPVMIEETFKTDRQYWPEDDRWAGHYLLVTGYDDANQIFTVHDTEVGPNQKMTYTDLDEKWQSFNRVYIMVFPPEMQGAVESILGEDWDTDVNRQRALEASEKETQLDPKNAFAWFNLGSNYAYFARYNEAAQAYDTARTLGLPQRMLRYQFGPFMAYFHSLRNDDLMSLTKYALEITRTSEEAMLWRGWGFFREGKREDAVNLFRAALKIRPDYEDALYAIDYVTNN